MEPYVVRRSAWRMWGVSLLGVPMVVISLDLLTQQRLTTMLRDLVFRPDDTQLPEPRETVWAVALLIVGVIACVWGLKELLAPTKVVVAGDEGVAVRIRGPFRKPFRLAWNQIEDIGSGTVEDDGDHLPVVWIRSVGADVMPSDGWGARPLDDRTLALMALDWEVSHVAAAEGMSARAVAARTQPSDPLFDPGVLPEEPT